MRYLFVVAVASFLATPVSADVTPDDVCMRLVPYNGPLPRGTDGPGSFGPLHDQLTLGCLRFVKVVKEKGVLYAILLDERGGRFKVAPGHMVGENDGRISEITETRITLIQIVRGADGEYMELPRYIFRANAK